MKKTPAAFVQYSFFLLAAVLMALGVMSMFRATPDPTLKIFYMLYAVLMFGDALAMLLCGLFICAGKPVVFWFAVATLSLNILLSIFDQFGWVDLLFVLLNAATLGLILNLRKELTSQ